MEGNQGKVKEKWGKFTDDDIAKIKGQREQFVGVMQQRYGKNKEEAEREFDALRKW